MHHNFLLSSYSFISVNISCDTTSLEVPKRDSSFDFVLGQKDGPQREAYGFMIQVVKLLPCLACTTYAALKPLKVAGMVSFLKQNGRRVAQHQQDACLPSRLKVVLSWSTIFCKIIGRVRIGIFLPVIQSYCNGRQSSRPFFERKKESVMLLRQPKANHDVCGTPLLRN